jgi:hypothetical protein
LPPSTKPYTFPFRKAIFPKPSQKHALCIEQARSSPDTGTRHAERQCFSISRSQLVEAIKVSDSTAATKKPWALLLGEHESAQKHTPF